jgi:hypothetical protein
MNCYNDWADHFMNRAIDQVSGRIIEPITLTEENAWNKRRSYRFDNGSYTQTYYWYNMVSGRDIEITKEEFQNQTQPPL